MIINKGIDRVNVGDFVQKVTVLKPQQSRNDRGAIEQQWIEVAELFGKLVISPVDETMVDQNLVNPDRMEFTTYVMNDITSEYRVMVEDTLYCITSVFKLSNQPLMVIRGEKITER